MYQDYLIRSKELKVAKEVIPLATKKPLKSISKLTKESLKNYKNFNNQFNNESKNLISRLNKISSHVKSLNAILKTENNLLLLGLFAITGIIAHFKDKQTKKYSTQYAGAYAPSSLSQGKLSKRGIDFIAQEEGLRTKAYKDTQGNWTIGIGHTGLVRGQKINQDTQITEEEAKQLFAQDVQRAENYVNEKVKVPVSQNMFDAMVSYVFNVGYLGPNFLRKLNSGDYQGASQELTTKNKELQNRRAREQKLFSVDIQNNQLSASPINYPTVRRTDSGNIRSYANSTKIGNYIMANPVAHGGVKYIDVSDKLYSYLKESNGQGYITSGAEGNHASGRTISHKLGNKVDVVALNSSSWESWADTAIPFIRNNHTAYINFEDFTLNQFNQVKAIILRKQPNLANKFAEKSIYSFHPSKFLIFYYRNPKHNTPALHLDIGIKPDAYSEYEYNTSKKNQSKVIPQVSQNNIQPKNISSTKNEDLPQGNTLNIENTNRKNKFINTNSPSLQKLQKDTNKNIRKNKKS